MLFMAVLRIVITFALGLLHMRTQVLEKFSQACFRCITTTNIIKITPTRLDPYQIKLSTYADCK